MIKIFKVTEENILFDFLEINSIPKKKIKQLLKFGKVLVNDKVTSQFNFKLKKNDIVKIVEERTNFRTDKSNLKIIYEDKNIIVVDKPAGLLTVSTEKEKEHTLYYLVSDYIKKSNYKNKVFIINRLDKGTSGIVMFAKSEKVKEMYQNNWNDLVIKREYFAIVEGVMNTKSGTITKKLDEDSKGRVFISNDGKNAITKYNVIKVTNDYTLLNINIETGRKNQIRVHMKSLGYPIVGDAKYGSLKSPIRRMGLHASQLIIKNPNTKEEMVFESKVPKEFKYLFKEEK